MNLIDYAYLFFLSWNCPASCFLKLPGAFFLLLPFLHECCNSWLKSENHSVDILDCMYSKTLIERFQSWLTCILLSNIVQSFVINAFKVLIDPFRREKWPKKLPIFPNCHIYNLFCLSSSFFPRMLAKKQISNGIRTSDCCHVTCDANCSRSLSKSLVSMAMYNKF